MVKLSFCVESFLVRLANISNGIGKEDLLTWEEPVRFL